MEDKSVSVVSGIITAAIIGGLIWAFIRHTKLALLILLGLILVTVGIVVALAVYDKNRGFKTVGEKKLQERVEGLILRIRRSRRFSSSAKDALANSYCGQLMQLAEDLLSVIAAYNQAFAFDSVIPISAKTRDGLEELLTVCEQYAVESPWFFPADATSDQPERQVIAEIIREKMLWNLEKEIPHGTAVEITRFSERDNGIVDVEATIYCEKASHKGIIIGKGGQMLKKICSQARADCERFMGTKVYLQTWIKVKENWRDSDFMIRNFGYTGD